MVVTYIMVVTCIMVPDYGQYLPVLWSLPVLWVSVSPEAQISMSSHILARRVLEYCEAPGSDPYSKHKAVYWYTDSDSVYL